MHARPPRPTIALLVLIAGMLAGCPTSSPPTTITYHPNGGSGTPPTDTTAYASGATSTILGPGHLTRTNHTFTGWNTEADGSGTPYQPNDTLTVGATPITLYATWRLQATIALGQSYTAALLGDGSLYVWGSNAFGALGDGSTADKSTPTRVPGFPPAGATVTAIATGTFHTAALLSDGALYTWGASFHGQLGDGRDLTRRTPTLVPDFPPPGTSITAIATGSMHTAAVLDDGSLYLWGWNHYGQLGDGATDDKNTPTRVPGFPPPGTTVAAIATGSSHTAALLSDGALYAWGRNAYGQLGDGSTDGKSTPTRVPGFPPPGTAITAIATGGSSTAAVLDDGSLYVWGANHSGQVGDGTDVDRLSPTRVPGFPPPGSTVTAIALGDYHAGARSSDGALFTWGQNVRGQLGDGATTQALTPTPTRVPDFPPPGTTVTAIALGQYHSAAMLSDGSVHAWGRNHAGQLGDGTNEDANVPTLVPGFPPAGGTSR